MTLTDASTAIIADLDEELCKGKFDLMWDPPVWEVASYRDLYLARHRALAFLSAMAAEVGGGEEGEEASSLQLEENNGEGLCNLGRVADCCEELARAVNASRHVVTTDETLEAADCLRGLRRMLLVVKKQVERSPSSSLQSSKISTSKDEAAGRALLAVCSAFSAVVTRCDSVCAVLLATHTNTIGTQLLRACFASSLSSRDAHNEGEGGLGWSTGAGQVARSVRPPPPASLDALAASLGGRD
jgi:hypothetical protein